MRPARNLILTGGVALVLTLAGCSGDDPDPAAEPTPPSDDVATAGSDPPVTGDPVEATRLADIPGDTALRPGRYAMAFPGEEDDLPMMLIDLPAGYTAGSDFEVVGEDDPFRHLGAWTVTDVATSPCDDDSEWVDPGPGVADLAEALTALPIWEATRPTPITIGGHEGVSLELNVPDRLPTRCADQLPSWRDALGDTQQIGPGKTQRLWIVDVGGSRLMILVGYFPGAEGPDPAQVSELNRMATRARFVDADQVVS